MIKTRKNLTSSYQLSLKLIIFNIKIDLVFSERKITIFKKYFIIFKLILL